MQSEAGSPLATKPSQAPVTSPSMGVTSNPIASEVLKNLSQKGDTPLDWVRNSLRAAQPEPELKPEETIQEVEASREAIAPEPEAPPTPSAEPAPVEPPVTESPEPPEDVEAEKLIEDVPNVPAAENFKKLRTKLKETAKVVLEANKVNKKLEEQLQKYTTGEVLPEALLEKDNEIQRLSKFEKIHSLKTSKEYEEAFVKPLDELQAKIENLAVDYDIPKEEVRAFVNKAISIPKQSDLNRFLAEHFDDVGALEVKQLINQTREISQKAKEAENEPARALDALIEEHRRIEEFRDSERKSRVASVSRDSWTDSLLKIREEGQVPELIIKDSDPEHNDTYVKPILAAASQEYAKLVTELAANGLKQLPRDLGFALARMVQLAHASAISIKSRNEALKYAEDIERNTKRTSSMVRPPIGSSGGSSGAVATKALPSSPGEAADLLLKNIMKK